MDCDTQRISCQLDRIASLLEAQQGIDPLSVVSGIVVPLILGIATVILAVFTIRTAKETNRLSDTQEQQRVAREDRQRRLDIIPDLVEWTTWELLLAGQKGAPGKQLTAARETASAQGQRLGEPSFDSLRAWIREQVSEYAKSADKQLASVYPQMTYVIQQWADDPETLRMRKRSEIQREVLNRVLTQIEAQGVKSE